MGLALVATIAFSFWIISYSLGLKSFDGFLIALIIIVTAGGVQMVASRFARGRRTS